MAWRLVNPLTYAMSAGVPLQGPGSVSRSRASKVLSAPGWWWNPLSYVTDEEKAYKLTQHFSAGSRVPGSKPDAYFDPKAEDILSGSRTSEGYCLGIMAIFLTKNGGIKPGTVHRASQVAAHMAAVQHCYETQHE
jgi:hypothetical protein